MSKQTILLVEDNERLNDGNRRMLESEGYEVLTALTLAEARERLAHSPDVILLDIMLPDGNGTDFCAEIRAVSDAHVLFLTSRREHEEKLRSLRAGGDDYITKPFKMDELLERVASSIRRRGMSKARAQSITKGSLTLDVIARRAYLSGEDLCLTPMEYGVLLLLAQNEGQAMSAEAVYEKVWGVPPVRADRNTVKKTVSCVRGKIEPSGYTIHSIYGKGAYVLERA